MVTETMLIESRRLPMQSSRRHSAPDALLQARPKEEPIECEEAMQPTPPAVKSPNARRPSFGGRSLEETSKSSVHSSAHRQARSVERLTRGRRNSLEPAVPHSRSPTCLESRSCSTTPSPYPSASPSASDFTTSPTQSLRSSPLPSPRPSSIMAQNCTRQPPATPPPARKRPKTVEPASRNVVLLPGIRQGPSADDVSFSLSLEA